MALAARTKNLTVIREGEATVKITRPITGLPSGQHFWYGSVNGRKCFRVQRLAQNVRVSFKVTQDNGMLDELRERAMRNQSGIAVRGPAKAYAGSRVDVDLAGVQSLIRRAANLASHKASDGPLVATVKLLDTLEPHVPTCSQCKQPLEAHSHETIERSWETTECWFCPDQGDPQA